MNTINVQLPESINNSALPKVDEVHLTLKACGTTFGSGSIRWKANSATTFTVRKVTASGETTSSVTLSQGGWSDTSFADQDTEIFISPKSRMSEFQLKDAISEHVKIDWYTLVYSSIQKLITYRSYIDPAILSLLTSITEWNSTFNQQEIDIVAFTGMSSMVNLNLSNSKVTGNLEKISLLTNLRTLNLDRTTGLYSRLSAIALCTGLQNLICSDNEHVIGILEDLNPLKSSLTNLGLNGDTQVSGSLVSLKQFGNVTNCSLGNSGVTGNITDLNGMKTGTLSLRVSGYMTNNYNSIVFVNNNIYTISFNSSKNVSGVTG